MYLIPEGYDELMHWFCYLLPQTVREIMKQGDSCHQARFLKQKFLTDLHWWSHEELVEFLDTQGKLLHALWRPESSN